MHILMTLVRGPLARTRAGAFLRGKRPACTAGSRRGGCRQSEIALQCRKATTEREAPERTDAHHNAQGQARRR